MEGKVALITGSHTGIGLGIARALAARKCHVIVHGRRQEEEVAPHLEKIKCDFGIDATYLQFDLANLDGIESICKTLLEKHKRVDILINNAGFQHVSGVTEFPLARWREMIDVMLTAPFLLTKHLLPHMRAAGWGRIINVGSVLSHVGNGEKPCYTAVKHAILGLSKSVALETAGSGVTCNTLCPGIVHTHLIEKQIKEKQKKQGFATYQETWEHFLAALHPSKQPVTTEQLGETAAFLCSSAADQITGTSINVDGGYVAN